MISAGSLDVGARLPTVRELSRRLGVSPTTVSEAWRRLADVGAIETRGRNGTFVRHPTGPGGPRRYRQISEGPGHFALDLSSGTPDPDLLPDLAPIVAKVSRQSLTSSYLDNPVLPALEDELRSTWPFPPEAITVVDGALDALDRVAGVALHLGDRVVVEHPGFPPMLDLLERLSCDVVGVDVDDEGLDVAQLAAVLGDRRSGRRDPPTTSPEPRRRGDVGTPGQGDRRAVCGRPKTLVIEDDHANEISTAPLTSVGTWLPERTVHIRSFSKSHGPDLRLAAVGGAGDVVTAVENRRLLGPGWSSRILQSVLLELIRHPETDDMLGGRPAHLRRPATAVSRVLVEHGVDVTGTDGINLWMGVDDERAAVVALAAQGIGVAPGTPFLVRPDSDHLRVTVGALSPERGLAEVAERLAAAASLATTRRRRSPAPPPLTAPMGVYMTVPSRKHPSVS